METQGTPAASAASDTGFTVSGADVVRMRSTSDELMRSAAACAARVPDWLSSVMICTLYFLPPMVRPLSNALRASDTTYGSGSPNPASGPVSGLTYPILMVPVLLEPPVLPREPHASSRPPATIETEPAPSALSTVRRVTG